MFAKAYELASAFTYPVIISARYFDGAVESGLASMTLLNADGWAATAAHVFDIQTLFVQHQPEVADYLQKKAQIEAHPLWEAKHKQREIERLPTNPKWVLNQHVWFGLGQGAINPQIVINPDADLALVCLQPFDSSAIANYPLIKKPDLLRSGTSLCELGFPLYA